MYAGITGISPQQRLDRSGGEDRHDLDELDVFVQEQKKVIIILDWTLMNAGGGGETSSPGRKQ